MSTKMNGIMLKTRLYFVIKFENLLNDKNTQYHFLKISLVVVQMG